MPLDSRIDIRLNFEDTEGTVNVFYDKADSAEEDFQAFKAGLSVVEIRKKRKIG